MTHRVVHKAFVRFVPSQQLYHGPTLERYEVGQELTPTAAELAAYPESFEPITPPATHAAQEQV